MNPAIIERRSGGRRVPRGRRRRYPRVMVGFEGVYESPERMLIAAGNDLNCRGAFLATAVPDSLGNLATLRLALPGSTTMLKVLAQVIHSNDDPSAGPTGMGVRFLELQPWQLKRIASLLITRAGLASLSERSLP